MLTPLAYGKMACDQILRDYHTVNQLPPQKYKHATCNYQQGVLLNAMAKIYELSGDKRYLEYILEWAEEIQTSDGKIQEYNDWIGVQSLDFRQGGNVLLYLYEKTQNSHYLDLAGYLVSTLHNYPVNERGGFWHMSSAPNQMWLDGLFMVGPLLCRYATLTGEKRYFDTAVQQLKLMYQNMLDPQTGLLRHGWDPGKAAEWADRETGLSGEVWGRACGWFAAAVADILEYLPENYPERNEIIRIQYDLLTAIIACQSDEGRWYQVVDKWREDGNWPENSSTSLFVYAIYKGIRCGYLDAEMRSSAQRAYRQIIRTLLSAEQNCFLIGDICTGTCIDDGSYEHYIQRDKKVNGIHGMGPFIMMTAEAEQNSL